MKAPAKWVRLRVECARQALAAGDQETATRILRRLLDDIDKHGIHNSWVPSSLLDLPPYTEVSRRD